MPVRRPPTAPAAVDIRTCVRRVGQDVVNARAIIIAPDRCAGFLAAPRLLCEADAAGQQSSNCSGDAAGCSEGLEYCGDAGLDTCIRIERAAAIGQVHQPDRQSQRQFSTLGLIENTAAQAACAEDATRPRSWCP